MSWEMVKLGDVSQILSGKGFPKKHQGLTEGDIAFAKVSDISLSKKSRKKYLSKAANYVSYDVANDLKISPFPPFTIVFAKVGEAIRLNYRAITSCEMLFDNNVMGVYAEEGKTLPLYLYYFLQNIDFYAHATVTAVPALRKATISNLKIPLPPLPEQQRIAALLEQVDHLRHLRQRALQRLDDLVQSTFLEMFGDPVTNPKGWEKGRIRDLVEETQYGTSEKSNENGKFPVLRMGNITYEGHFDFSDLKYTDIEDKDLDKYLVQKGDLLFNRTNSRELVGKTAVYQEESPMAYAGYLVRLRTNKHGITEYISGYLNSFHGKETLKHMCKSIVGMANINAQEMQNIKILLPPIEEQYKYAKLAQKVREKKQHHQTSLNQLDTLFNALMQQAFTGQLQWTSAEDAVAQAHEQLKLPLEV